MDQGLFSITTDKNSLISTISYERIDNRLMSSINLTISTISENYLFHESSILIPWGELKRGLTHIVYQLKKAKVKILLDDFTKELIERLISDRSFRQLRSKYLEFSEIEITKILEDNNFQRELTIEQIRDVKTLLSIKHGANFSVPGAGKTTTILAVHTILNSLNLVECLFVICPINAFISWDDEIESIFGIQSKKIIRLQSADLSNFHIIEDKEPYLILVNYEKLRRDIENLFPFFLHTKIHLVLDESHRLKGGFQNQSFIQINKLVDLAKRRDILSGTPMPQNFSDISSQMELLWGDDVIPEINSKTDEEKALEVNKKISGLFVRTKKNELGLPPPIIQYRFIEMGNIQKDLYKLIKSESARNLFFTANKSKMFFRQMGRSVVRLLEAATNPMLLGTEEEYSEDQSIITPDSELWQVINEFSKYEKPAKIEYLIKRVDEILDSNPKNKIVIWSFFVRNILLLEKLLQQYNPVTIFGGIPSNDEDENNREARIRRFHNDKSCRLLIANPQAGGEGISLHKVCHFAIYLDRNFNAAHYLQSVDRIHRLGLGKNIETHVEIIVAKNTIDEIAIERLNKKTENMANVLNDQSLLRLSYDPSDIDEATFFDDEDIRLIQKHLME